MSKPHPTKVPNSVYVQAKVASVTTGKSMYDIATEAVSEYLEAIKTGEINPRIEAKEFERIFINDKLHMWTVTMDDEIYKRLKHASIDFEMDIYKGISMAVRRYIDKKKRD